MWTAAVPYVSWTMAVTVGAAGRSTGIALGKTDTGSAPLELASPVFEELRSCPRE